jgi:formate hydrogenlyase subunit 3/multisubunit Na+/H+ antiporter MnhD subunit
MSAQILLFAPVIIPLFAAIFLLPMLRKNPKAAALLVLVSVIVSGLAFWAATGSEPRVDQPWVEVFTLSFSLDSWKTFLLGFVFLFQLLTALYSLGTLHRLERPYLYLLALLLAFSSASMVILTDNLLLLVVGWEVFLLALYLMIHSGGRQAEPTAHKALIIGGTSDFLMILGVMFYLTISATPEMTAGVVIDGSPMAFWAFLLIFLGAGAKAGMFPFHTWIPDAAKVMPASGFAGMPASLEKIIGIYFLFVLTSKMFVLNSTAQIVMICFGIATIFVALIPALGEKDLRKILGLTAIAPVGFMVCGMAFSEAAGYAGALLYMLTHATYKSAMFFCAGNFEEKAGSSQLERLLGIAHSMPLSGAAFFLAFLAAISLPPTGGFMAKELIFEGALHGGFIIALALLVVGAILNVAVFSRVIAVLWAPGSGGRNEVRGIAVLATVFLGVAAVAGGLVYHRGDALLSGVTGAEPGLIAGVWHFSILTVVSLAVLALGFMMYVTARTGRENAAQAFSTLASSPVLGPALKMAEEKKFDGYEIGIKVVGFITRITFLYVERLIDIAGNGIIAGGRWLTRPLLSGSHNGVYGNYLCWTVVGFLIVLFFLFSST